MIAAAPKTRVVDGLNAMTLAGSSAAINRNLRTRVMT